jgi:hypothetical protein
VDRTLLGHARYRLASSAGDRTVIKAALAGLLNAVLEG